MTAVVLVVIAGIVLIVVGFRAPPGPDRGFPVGIGISLLLWVLIYVVIPW